VSYDATDAAIFCVGCALLLVVVVFGLLTPNDDERGV